MPGRASTATKLKYTGRDGAGMKHEGQRKSPKQEWNHNENEKRKLSERPRNRSEKTQDVQEGWWDSMVWQEKDRKHGKCNVLEASKAPELEKTVVGRSGPELVHMTRANIKEDKPLKRGPYRKGFRKKSRAIECTIQNLHWIWIVNFITSVF